MDPPWPPDAGFAQISLLFLRSVAYFAHTGTEGRGSQDAEVRGPYQPERARGRRKKFNFGRVFRLDSHTSTGQNKLRCIALT